MNKIRLTFIITVILSVFIAVFPVSANETGGITDEKYELLTALDFFDGNKIVKTAPIAKGDFINAVMKPILKVNDVSYSGETGFSDVTPNAVYAKSAFAAKALGYVYGDTFNGDDTITVEEACRILINITGYSNIYGNNFTMVTAQKIGLLKNLEEQKELTYGGMVTILNNLLYVKYLGTTAFTSDGIQYDVYNAKTFMTEVLHINYGIGIINSNENTKLSLPEEGKKGTVTVGETRYYYNNQYLPQLLGCKVRYFYKFDKNSDEESTIVYANVETYNNIIEIESAEIESFSNNLYTYKKNNDKTDNYRVSKTADFIYNGKAIEQGFHTYIPKNGKVKLIDNNDDSIADAVIITDYIQVVVKNVDKNNYRIYDMYDGDKTIDINPDNINYTITDKNNTPFALSSIKKWQVLSVARSMDKKLVSMIISYDRADGIITEYSDEQISVDEISYTISEGIDFEINNNIVKINRVSANAGDYGYFYLDFSGRIVAFEKIAGGKQSSGYLIGVGKERNLNNDVLLKIFDEKGQFTIYKTIKNFKINGVKYLTPQLAIDEIEKFNDANGGQLVLFRLNNSGEINELELAKAYDAAFDITGFRKESPDKTYIAHKILNFSNMFRIESGKTKTFVIPRDIQDEEQFEFYDKDKQYFDFNKWYTVTAYTASDTFPYVEYIIAHKDADGEATALYDPNLFIVEKITDLVNSKGDPTVKLYGMQSGVQRAYILRPLSQFSNVTFHSGDILSIKVNAANEIIAYVKLFDGQTMNVVGANPSTTDAMAEYRYLFGNVYSNRGGTLFVTTKNVAMVTNKNDGEYAFSDIYKSIYKFNTKLNKLSLASSDDIKDYKTSANDYSKLFLFHHYADAEILVIYE